jgi:hypothetical protein
LASTNTALPAGSVGLYSYEPNVIDYDAVSVAAGGGSAATPGGGGPPPPPTLSRVLLTPDSVNLLVGASAQFAASGLMSDGSSSALSADFTATGGTVTSSGNYTAGAVAGTFAVIGTHSGSGLADTSVVVVSAPLPTASDYATHFAEDAVGQAPALWTETAYPVGSDWLLASESGAVDGRSLRNVVTTTGRHILRLDAVPASGGTQEILVRMRMGDADTRGPGVALRHTMGSAESGYVAYLRPTQNLVEINAFVNGAWALVGAATFQNDPGLWYWLRFRVEGSTLRVRAWIDGQQEPTSWTYSGTNSSLSAGTTGLYTYEPNTIDYDLVSVAIGGASAAAPAN